MLLQQAIRVQLMGKDNEGITFEAKPSTTMERLVGYWVQHLEWKDEDVAIDASRLRYVAFALSERFSDHSQTCAQPYRPTPSRFQA